MTKHPSRILGFWLLCALITPASVDAQIKDDRYKMTIGSDFVAGGQSVTVPVTLDMMAGAAGPPLPLQGWSFGVCHDPLEVSVDAVVDGFTTATVNNGAAPAFNAMNIAPMPGSGFTIGVVIDLFGNFLLPPGTGYELNLVTYSFVGTNCVESVLQFCASLGTPPVETLMVEGAGVAIVPIQCSGTIGNCIGDDFLELYCSDAEVFVGSPFTLAITLDHSAIDVEGFSFGLVHDATVADLTTIMPGAALMATNGGAGPEFFQNGTDPVLPPGVTGGGFVGAVISVTPPFDVIPASLGSEVALFNYNAVAAGESSVEFSGDVSMPPVAIVVSSNMVSEVPTTAAGSMLVLDLQEEYLVGDTNSDTNVTVSDAIFLAKAVFNAGPMPGCEASGDIDGNQLLDLIDALALLSFLFEGGPAPVAPFPTCGLGSPGTLGCAISNCPQP